MVRAMSLLAAGGADTIIAVIGHGEGCVRDDFDAWHENKPIVIDARDGIVSVIEPQASLNICKVGKGKFVGGGEKRSPGPGICFGYIDVGGEVLRRNSSFT